jgi:hypothetical protein|tara:strand:- start:189 stop:437 length:249 start_codon:yes stop_codon:yes gene_type:complete
METVTTEELEQIASTRQKVFDLKNDIAENIIFEERCKADRSRLMFNFNQAETEYGDVQKQIKEKYGEITVNLQTGEIVHNGD